MEHFKPPHEYMLAVLSEKLKETLGTIPSLNSGGCGIAAHALCKELAKVHIYAEIVDVAPSKSYHDWENLDIPGRKNLINEYLQNDPNGEPDCTLSSYHYVVYVPCLNVYLDSGGVYYPELAENGEDYQIELSTGVKVYMLGDYTADEMDFVNQQYRQWNRQFDRCYIPEVKFQAGEAISAFKKHLPYDADTVQSGGVQRWWDGNFEKPSFITTRPSSCPMRPNEPLSYNPQLREAV